MPVHCVICSQERHHAFFYIKRRCVCTDCGIAIVKLADTLGLAMVSKNLAKHQETEQPLVSPVAPYGIIANNGANNPDR